ncbi:MAG: heavy metal translocating P-type ATPase metal-binding domain-containing protein, partial [Thermoanaerobaculia bacterium]|nr:heavy metal translocating P-type ATPase metal-binding domain-containing protein [Thermoanaerobaculia bacterium]
MPTDRCRHCRTPIPADAGTEPFCCRGCAAVHALLMQQGLGRYYELAGDRVVPPPPPAAAAPRAWLEPLLAAA